MVVTATCQDGLGGSIAVVSTQQGSDIGSGIASGQGKHIVWDADIDMPNHAGDDYVVEVRACDSGVCETLFFDGGDCVLVAPDTSFDVESLTVEAWIRIEYHSSYPTILGTRHPTNSGDPYALWVKHQRLCLSVAETGQFDFNPGDPLPIGQWLHVAGTYDGAYLRTFIDGAIVDSVGWTGTIADASSWPVTIGIDWDIAGYHSGWYGHIGEVRVWSYARTAGELAASGSELGIDTDPRLIARWVFQEGPEDQQVLDSSLHANDGCLGGTCEVDDRDPVRGGCED